MELTIPQIRDLALLDNVWVVHTQHLENYGAHSEDGKFVNGHAYWKFKGGQTYLVTDLDRRQDALAFVAALCMTNTLSWKEFPTEVDVFSAWLSALETEAAGDVYAEEYITRTLGSLLCVSPKSEQIMSLSTLNHVANAA